MATPRNDIENNGTYYRKQAQQALKAAKLLEKQNRANGGKYVKTGLRSWTLKKEQTRATTRPDSDFLGQKAVS